MGVKRRGFRGGVKIREDEVKKLMVMKHNAHPLLLDPVSALLVGCAPSALDMNLVDVCVSMAGPVVLVVEA